MDLWSVHLCDIAAGAPREYRSMAAITSLYPGAVRDANLHMFRWSYPRPALSVLSKIGAAEPSVTIWCIIP